ncbi:MAG: hypothetical protein A3F68_06670 [Acidobacteria bacterium RIFCSPLOWO2_12_FULL_54_10]|nr:MAG: hypothetical protein A3F68_06670 [Acidobacteria bacterium RIFCSPLOWO2_12_FULL_54_10]
MQDSLLKTTWILVVGNDPEIVKAAQNCLSPRHFTILTANTANAALELLDRSPFSLVLCDLRLPDNPVQEFLSRATAIAPHASFLMIAEKEDCDLAVESMRIGAHDCLWKPLESHALHLSVERIKLGHETRREEVDHRRVLEETLQERTEHLRQALQQVDLSQNLLLEALVSALDARERETHLHSLRVQAFSLLLAEKCGYSMVLRKQLGYGALLHDIGKIAIPDAILMHPGRLTTQQFQMMKQHTVYGYQMLSRIPSLVQAATMALCHHERVDGKGYPLKLQGASIPLEARIFSVADAFDVITTGRSYCPPRSFEDARKEIRRCAGTQFDKEIADVFLSIPREKWDAAREVVEKKFDGFFRSISPIFPLSVIAD